MNSFSRNVFNMVSADDCPCTDATEASVTSLQSDSFVTDSNIRKTHSEPTNKDKDVSPKYNCMLSKKWIVEKADSLDKCSAIYNRN